MSGDGWVDPTTLQLFELWYGRSGTLSSALEEMKGTMTSMPSVI